MHIRQDYQLQDVQVANTEHLPLESGSHRYETSIRQYPFLELVNFAMLNGETYLLY